MAFCKKKNKNVSKEQCDDCFKIGNLGFIIHKMCINFNMEVNNNEIR